MSRYFFIIFLFLSMTISSAIAQTTLTMGIASYASPLSSYTKQEKFVRYIEENTDITVRPLVFKNNDELILQYKKGKIDFAWIGTVQYMKHRNELYSYVLVRPIRRNREFYRGVFIAHSSSEINGLIDLKSKSVAFVSKTSEAGFIFPALTLHSAGLTITKDYYPEFLRGHDNVIYAVQQKKYDAGAVFDSALEVYLNDSQRSQIKILGYTKEIPFEPIIISKRIDKNIAQTLQRVLVECTSTMLLSDLNIDRFIESSDTPYQIYRPGNLDILNLAKETP
ncbi:MAG: phosphate/phosphite/phosphonate ABC transporter substrate-binding protein [Spirochaetes bacterium]|jgi:phosphonate transport system substrate-binding protein|nr:phosphate/phosphite/phosphonate ABC transporter substrate-binding protein [Spirochaetota bacterium]